MRSASIDAPGVHTPTPLYLEVCVETLAGARAAVAGGADAIELCGALALGGLTPSTGLIETVMAIARPAGVAVRAMVRPRAGDFAYGRDDLAVAIAEARALLAAGADGLVFGAVRDGYLDRDALLAWREAVAPPAFTIHRAIDTTADPVAAMDVAVAVGADQVLSSGGRRSAVAGVTTLAAMASRKQGRCRVVAGAGVRPCNVATFVAAGLDAIHASARAEPSAAAGDDPFGFGNAPPPTDEATVRALRATWNLAVAAAASASSPDRSVRPCP